MNVVIDLYPAKLTGPGVPETRARVLVTDTELLVWTMLTLDSPYRIAWTDRTMSRNWRRAGEPHRFTTPDGEVTIGRFRGGPCPCGDPLKKLAVRRIAVALKPLTST